MARKRPSFPALLHLVATLRSKRLRCSACAHTLPFIPQPPFQRNQPDFWGSGCVPAFLAGGILFFIRVLICFLP